MSPGEVILRSSDGDDILVYRDKFCIFLGLTGWDWLIWNVDLGMHFAIVGSLAS